MTRALTASALLLAGCGSSSPAVGDASSSSSVGDPTAVTVLLKTLHSVGKEPIS